MLAKYQCSMIALKPMSFPPFVGICESRRPARQPAHVTTHPLASQGARQDPLTVRSANDAFGQLIGNDGSAVRPNRPVVRKFARRVVAAAPPLYGDARACIP